MTEPIEQNDKLEVQSAMKNNKLARKKNLIGIVGLMLCIAAIAIFFIMEGKQENQNDDIVSATETSSTLETATTVTPVETSKPTPEPVRKEAQIDITQIDTSDYPNIKMYFSIKDLDGTNIADISTGDLKISERTDGNWKEISGINECEKVETDDKKTVAMVMDTSGSIAESLEQAKYAADSLLECMEEDGNYNVSLTSFNSQQNVLQDFTDHIPLVFNEISELYADGETAFYDTLENTLYKSNNQEGQKYILAFTDGADNLSVTSKDEVIELAKEYKIPTYIISTLEEEQTLDLINIAESSGGELYHINNVDSLKDIYLQIFQLQKNQMYLSYQTHNKDQWI